MPMAGPGRCGYRGQVAVAHHVGEADALRGEVQPAARHEVKRWEAREPVPRGRGEPLDPGLALKREVERVQPPARPPAGTPPPVIGFAFVFAAMTALGMVAAAIAALLIPSARLLRQAAAPVGEKEAVSALTMSGDAVIAEAAAGETIASELRD
jgi:hypothetical protein